MRQSLYIFASVFMLLATTVSSNATALWPLNKNAIAEAPPVEQLENKCEGYRKKVIELNQSSAVGRFFNRPRRYFLKEKHRKCLKKYYREEYEYLKSVTIDTTRQANQENLPPLNAISNSTTEGGQ